LKIDEDLKELIQRTQNNQLTPSDFADSTFSVSSFGNIGGRYFVPTILRPQAAIIAIGKSHTQARYNEANDEFEPMEVINFSISADHRILDGATVAKFGSSLKRLIENPH